MAVPAMPDERFLHKRLGHSKKIKALTDFEFRVWTQYQLSADDCGVMRHSAVTIQADNSSLETRPAKSIMKALDRLVDIGLLLSFEHQGEHYVCQHDWQKYQKVRYPRTTIHPAPTSEVLSKCCAETQKLFRLRHSATSEESPKSSGSSSEESPVPARAGGREWLTANGNSFGNGQEETAPNELRVVPVEADDRTLRVQRFMDEYRDLHEEIRGVAYLGNPLTDYREAQLLIDAFPDHDYLMNLVKVFLYSDDEFARSGTATIAKFRSRASWCAERMQKEFKKRGIAS
jgi:hypothetical protein